MTEPFSDEDEVRMYWSWKDSGQLPDLEDIEQRLAEHKPHILHAYRQYKFYEHVLDSLLDY